MDFGNYEGLKKPHAFVSADMILYHKREYTGDLLNDVEILVSTRKIEPFQNYLSLTFGGYIDPTDNSPLHTAIRETKEESGIDLYKNTPRDFTFLGSFGPARVHQHIKPYTYNDIRFHTITEGTEQPGNTRPCVTFAFAFCCRKKMEGYESDEATSIQWMSVRKIITEYGDKIAFDHARFLHTLIERVRDISAIHILQQAGEHINWDEP